MITHILFDLDNTLYASSNNMEKEIAQRMFHFIADFLSLPEEATHRLHRAERKQYGTTLEWLEAKYGFTDRERYFAAIHPPSETTGLKPDPNLRGFLESLHMPMTVLTNAPLVHAHRVLDFFGVRDMFDGIFDITYHNGKGKPHADCYLRTLEAIGARVEETLFIDDCPDYVSGYMQLGGAALLVDEQNRHTALCIEQHIRSIHSIYELPAVLKEQNTEAPIPRSSIE